MNIAAGMNRASSRIEVGTSGFLSISDIDFRVSAELEQESQASSYVEVRNSACLSSCSWAVHGLSRPLLSCIWNLRLFPEDATVVSVLLRVVTSSQDVI